MESLELVKKRGFMEKATESKQKDKHAAAKKLAMVVFEKPSEVLCWTNAQRTEVCSFPDCANSVFVSVSYLLSLH